MPRSRAVLLVVAVLLVAGLALLSKLTGFLVDWLWFGTLGFGGVFATVWHTQLAAFGIAAAVSAALLAVNALVAVRAPSPRVRHLRATRTDRDDGEAGSEVIEFSLENLPWRLLVLVAAGVIGVLIGIGQAGNWAIFLKWLYAVPFERADPVFGRDLAFYVFTLPVYRLALGWAFLLVVLAAAMASTLYWARGAIELDGGLPRLSAAAGRHLSGLLALFFLLKAIGYILQRYDLLLGNNGVVVGAAYTDIHVRLPFLAALTVASLVGTALCAANLRGVRLRLPVLAILLLLAVTLAESVFASLFQSYRVKPDELRLESPYIARSIAFTRYGFGLDRIANKPFPAEGTITPAILAANDVTIQNIRWWDPRPLLDTYRQLQELRLYYDFRDVDIDRYTLNGTYQQVMLAARELNQARLPADAQTWINQHFKFTHGFGVVMSPVNRFDAEGLPVFYVKDIPPVSSVGVRLDRPQIYFGEETRNYVVVRGGTTEFDYAKGQDNVYTTYQGRAGVPLGSLWRRALFAWHFGDLKLLISTNVTAGSRVLLRRRIQDRISRVAPFLRLDRDPYLVVDDGRLVWLQDAYTVSDTLPYAQRDRTGVNYIRNAVKVAVDAYDGSLVFYVADPADPIVQTYERAFPSLFRPLDVMPATLRQHLRYPEDLFLLQAAMYGTYHMTDPEVFYNKEDLWSFPQENVSGKLVTMQPYYTIMRLPGESREEFILMLPMVPNTRDNMIAWLAARCDGPHYGTLIEFAFPKEKLLYGPAQVEARIDQDTTISQQLSLWNQTGSRVIRGNLLVIPIDDAILYVEPLYLRAENRELPELKRLIASAGDRVVMGQDVETLLAALVSGPGQAPPVVATGARPGAAASAAGPPGPAAAAEARKHYRAAQRALSQGDWRTFGAEMDALGRALEAGPGASSP
ncbi:MAG: UPF0182 family protein [Candidatus Rokubacteria bacterium]|nr:UPF0182 family protein [Candidatus Rokubacteria bacterium]